MAAHYGLDTPAAPSTSAGRRRVDELGVKLRPHVRNRELAAALRMAILELRPAIRLLLRDTFPNSAEVWFDGQSLHFPSGLRDTTPIDQAKACAADLARYLAGRTGEKVRVVPVVSLPGWYTRDRPGAAAFGMLVINPKMGSMLANQPGLAIPTAQRNRIINAIAERYPELEA